MERKVPLVTNQQSNSSQSLPATGNAAIYIRAAAVEMLNSNAEAQTVDLLALAEQHGFRSDHIIVFDQDNGRPGNTPIESREGLASLVQAMANSTIQALFVADENRLFHDMWDIQLSTFIEVCAKHKIKVITPGVIYDFTNFTHVNQFRFHCEQAFVRMQEAANEWLDKLLEED